LSLPVREGLKQKELENNPNENFWNKEWEKIHNKEINLK
jgi:hypothetical protein